eukprot:CAMPEP_0173173998 /NCGR_PEP_ID=MMETSP1141-20130122/3123_1 /TAXON_ID=483371 /ORGANISM="non described non described, Strain CCMP2298" /LENGTH=83 /DNA_ID=CAMNT_0014096103 /DNA_START=1028 /DNA_END=1279 /DNA_ORIENTATION=+
MAWVGIHDWSSGVEARGRRLDDTVKGNLRCSVEPRRAPLKSTSRAPALKSGQGDLDRQLSHRLLHAAAPAILPAVPRRTVNKR